MLEKIKVIAETLCNHPFRVLVVFNTKRLERFKLAEYTINSEKDLEQVKLSEQTDVLSVCYDVSENRIILNLKDKPEQDLSEKFKGFGLKQSLGY